MTESEPVPDVPDVPDVAESFERLSTSAAILNIISDELGKSITALDEALKRLNLGIPTWVPVKHYGDPNGDFRHHDIGYAKIGSKWGIALRTVEGNEFRDAGYESCDEWLFNDAPRHLRVEAVEKLPALLEGLNSAALDTAQRIRDKTAHARHVVEAVNAAAKTIESRAAAARRRK